MVTVAPRQNRGPGLVDTGTLNLATVLGAAVQPNTLYIGKAILLAADRDDPTLTLGQVSLFIDGAVVWGPSDMVCGLKDRNGVAVVPSFAWGSSGAGKTSVRITFTPSRVVSIGLDVSSTSLVR